jgi:hypothetical protein
MKKILSICLVIAFGSCGTITQSGRATALQKTKPEAGQPKRKLKTGAFVVGVLFLPSLVVDFATCEIYRK